VRPALDD